MKTSFLAKYGLLIGLLVGYSGLSLSQVDDAELEADLTAGQSADNAPLIKLQSTFVGDKEQPAISYFIPWKGIRSPDGLQWNIERKNDDTLEIVDREIMLRSVNIYNEMELESIP